MAEYAFGVVPRDGEAVAASRGSLPVNSSAILNAEKHEGREGPLRTLLQDVKERSYRTILLADQDSFGGQH